MLGLYAGHAGWDLVGRFENLRNYLREVRLDGQA